MMNNFIRIVYRYIKENDIIIMNKTILKSISAYSASVQVSLMFTVIINESIDYYNKNIEKKTKY